MLTFVVFLLVHNAHCTIFHVAQRELDSYIYFLYFNLNGNVKAEVFESVWMFADSAADDSWANVARLKQQKLKVPEKALEFFSFKHKRHM